MTKKQLLEYTREFRAGILSGTMGPQDMCFAVCAPLQSLLEMMDVPCALVDGAMQDGAGHFWIDLLDGNILDPTASQFRRPNGRAMPAIYHGPKPEWYHIYHQHEVQPEEAEQALRDYQESKWPRSIEMLNKLQSVAERVRRGGMMTC